MMCGESVDDLLVLLTWIVLDEEGEVQLCLVMVPASSACLSEAGVVLLVVHEEL
jgi:hypothetical protein